MDLGFRQAGYDIRVMVTGPLVPSHLLNGAVHICVRR